MEISKRFKFWRAILLILVFTLTPSIILAKGFEWWRFRLRPTISFSEKYTDNIYKDHNDRREDFVSFINPILALDFALAPRNYITLAYKGDYEFHVHYHNFRKFMHTSSLLWNWQSPRGSKILAGTIYTDKAYQAYSPKENYRNYIQRDYFFKSLWRIGENLGFHFTYGKRTLRFDSKRYTYDEYDANYLILRTDYYYFPFTAFLIEYDRLDQNNKDVFTISTDYIAHRILAGFTRTSDTAKLQGSFKIGYLFVDMEAGDNLSEWSIDSDLKYRLTNFISLFWKASRIVAPAIRADRDSGDYSLTTRFSFRARYQRNNKFSSEISFAYINKKYKFASNNKTVREDDAYKFRTALYYYPRRWITVSLEYSYYQNDSDYKTTDYKENIYLLKISLLNLMDKVNFLQF